MSAKGQPYRLEKLLEVKQREEEARQAALATAVQAAAVAREVMERAERSLAEREVRRDEARARATSATSASAGGVTAGDLVVARQWDGKLVADVEAARAEVARARQELAAATRAEELARDTLAVAVKERKAIAQHREKWEAEKKRETERRAEAAMDDRRGSKE